MKLALAAVCAATITIFGTARQSAAAEEGKPRMTERTNRLIHETSPYLLQHANNPVDWYPWGGDALTRAKQENKPIFLSIGYSACHWCHVMERESFENDSIAAIMNEFFVNIKVDREERPDLDDIYMSFVQMTTGSGGWPMSVFLTPEGKPFFGGTYFPPEESYGRPGFPQILYAVDEAWKTDRERLLHGADTAVERLQLMMQSGTGATALAPDLLDTAVTQMLERFDPIDGGFNGAPKFPPSYSLSVLMRYVSRTNDARTLKALTLTLDKMAFGGMYDQLGGGFHRYSVDAQWLVPHFEKMLYDNALLAVTYLEAYQLTSRPLYKRIGAEILDYVLRDMTDSTGGFHSAEDADSEGEEGKFYVWTEEEILSILGESDGKLFCDYYDVSNVGNFEHYRSIPHIRVAPEEFAKSYSLSAEGLLRRLQAARDKLMAARSQRVRPHKDDKILTDWNGLMLSALARGYQVTGGVRYLEAAQKCAAFLKREMHSGQGLMRVHRAGTTKQHGFITDYAFLINGLVDLYEADFDIAHLQWADTLAQEMLAKFADAGPGGFFMSVSGQEELLVRQKDSYDGAIPSGNSVAAMALARLATLLDKKPYRAAAEKAISALAANANKVPLAYMNLINAADFLQRQPREIAIVGSPADEGTSAMLKEIFSLYLPNRVIALLDSRKSDNSAVAALIPLLRDRPMIAGRATAYVCENFVCKLPVADPDALADQLAR